MSLRSPRDVADWAADVQDDLASLLATSEGSTHRVITVSRSYELLNRLSMRQDALMRESLQCVEHGLYRSAHVGAWVSFMDFLHEWCCEQARWDTLVSAYPAWILRSVDDFQGVKDYQLIDVLKSKVFISNTMKTALHGLLAKRNECAHPGNYEPDVNTTLGYVSDVMIRIAQLQEVDEND